MSSSIVSAIRRADQIFFELVGEKLTLEHGIAFFDQEHPRSQRDNVFREVWVEEAELMPQAWDEVEAFYKSHDLSCCGWVPALGQQVELIEPYLRERGLHRQSLAAMYVPDWPDLQVTPGLRVLPARAMRQAFRGLFDSAESAELDERRLDCPQVDIFVAVMDGQPAGRCSLLQAGEIGNIRDLYVAPEFRRRRVAASLLAHVLEMSHRLMMRIVCAQVDSQDAESITFLKHCGFEKQGELVEYHTTSRVL